MEGLATTVAPVGMIAVATLLRLGSTPVWLRLPVTAQFDATFQLLPVPPTQVTDES